MSETPKPLVWLATPTKEIPGNVAFQPEDFFKLPKFFREPLTLLIGLKDLPWDFELCMVAGGSVAQARNKIVAAFLRSKADGILMRDFDLMPNVSNFTALLSRGLPIVGGMYCRRQDKPQWVFNGIQGQGPDETGLMPVLELGTGFKYFHRSVFEAVRDKNPWLEYKSDADGKTEWGFFSMAPARDPNCWPGARWLTEDYWFDWLCRDAGFTTHMDTTIQLRHRETQGPYKGKVYPNVFPPIPGMADEKPE